MGWGGKLIIMSALWQETISYHHKSLWEMSRSCQEMNFATCHAAWQFFKSFECDGQNSFGQIWGTFPFKTSITWLFLAWHKCLTIFEHFDLGAKLFGKIYQWSLLSVFYFLLFCSYLFNGHFETPQTNYSFISQENCRKLEKKEKLE